VNCAQSNRVTTRGGEKRRSSSGAHERPTPVLGGGAFLSEVPPGCRRPRSPPPGCLAAEDEDPLTWRVLASRQVPFGPALFAPCASRCRCRQGRGSGGPIGPRPGTLGPRRYWSSTTRTAAPTTRSWATSRRAS
jgi:hypothetical protein